MPSENRYLPRPWILPSNYIGATWEGWLVFLGRNRDSDLLTNHNFETALEALEAPRKAFDSSERAMDDQSVQVVSENHWACGWIEWIAIHPSNEAAVKLANELADKLDQYPSLDDDGLTQREWESARDSWGRHSVCAALENAGVSKRTIKALPPMDQFDANFIHEKWTSDGADYETICEGPSAYFRFSDIGRDRAAWAIRWLRNSAR